MSYEILSVKLCELDEKIGKIHGRIHLSETDRHGQLRLEISMLEKECEETRMEIQNKLKFSKAPCISALFQAYQSAEEIIGSAREEISVKRSDDEETDRSAEEQILLAEYSLDFALQAVDQAVLFSMKAIEAQKSFEKKEERRTL